MLQTTILPETTDHFSTILALTERRDHPRHPCACDVWLSHARGLGIVRCQAENISEGGMRAIAPEGCTLSVGQRFVVRMGDGSPIGAHAGPGVYGTVVRTLPPSPETGYRLAFALRFDQPAASAHVN